MEPKLCETLFKRAKVALSPLLSLPLNPRPVLSHTSPLRFQSLPFLPPFYSRGEFVIRWPKLWAQHLFSFFSQAGEKTPNSHRLLGDRPSLMKSKLSIWSQHLHTGTNEARRSPTLIPLHLTHFIDSPCFSNEMLNISPSAEARWQPLLWRWR